MWSHYKAKVFSELATIAADKNIDLCVYQMAISKKNRKNLGQVDLSIHNYPYELLYSGSYEEIGLFKKIYLLGSRIIKIKNSVINFPGYAEPVNWILIPLALFRGNKIIVSVDSTIHDRKRVAYKEKIKQFFLRFADLVYCYGSSQTSYLHSLGVSQKKIHKRIQATDNKKFRDSFLKTSVEKKNIFLYVGRLSAEKNLELLIDTFKELKNNDWELRIIGAGNREAFLREKVDLESIPNVTFLGGVPWASVIEHYAESKVFILPSKSEPWGIVVNEAMLCECALIVSKHCGCARDLVQETKNGFTFNPNEKEDLAEKMQYYIDHPDLASKMGKRSWDFIKDETPEKAAQQMMEGYLKLKQA